MLGHHDRAVLQFSGGKDSLACLHLARPWWERITVLWVNTGDAFPETLAQMRSVREMVPHFMEVKAAQPEQIKWYGPPTDLLSVWDSPVGVRCFTGRPFKMQTPFDCCGANIWQPMHDAVRTLGATLVIRGQRNAEAVRAPIRSGHVENGIEYLFPLEDWTDERVVAFLKDKEVALPEHYRYVNTSLDCQHCTAYLFQNAGKFVYIRERHPSLYDELQRTLRTIAQAADTERANLTAVLDHGRIL